MNGEQTKPPIGIGLVGLASQGRDSYDHERLQALLRTIPYEDISIPSRERRRKVVAFINIFREIRRTEPRGLFLEGTGIAEGSAVLAAHYCFGLPFVVSTGDAVAPWVRAHLKYIWPVFWLYERELYHRSAGVIGWSPYLVGRALTLGAPRGVTIPGWAQNLLSAQERIAARNRIRESLNIGPDALVIGIAGSLRWNPRVEYCYGKEIIEAISLTDRVDVFGLIVGDGTGLVKLKELASDRFADRVRFVGHVDRRVIPEYLAAMDIGSLPQTIDGVGNFRYTTKITEYLAAELPIVTSRIPMAYDLDSGWIWRIPGDVPWGREYVEALRYLLENMTTLELNSKREQAGSVLHTFDKHRQEARITDFLAETFPELCVQTSYQSSGSG